MFSIWFCVYSVCSFRYMVANSFYAFFSFRAYIYIYIYELIPIYVSAWVCSRESICACYEFARTHTNTHTHTHIYMCVCVCVCVYVCVIETSFENQLISKPHLFKLDLEKNYDLDPFAKLSNTQIQFSFMFVIDKHISSRKPKLTCLRQLMWML